MSKHTPGPWEIKPHFDPAYRHISGPKHKALAQVVWCVDEEERSPDCEANAHLIAAAPELLEALEMMLEMSEMGGFGKAAAEDVARAAIAKAKGESNE